jgi:signal transduction histidine kinase
MSEILQEKISNIISDENVLNKLYVSEPIKFCPEESIVIFNRDGRAIPVTISINQISKEADQLFLMLLENIQELVDHKSKVAALEGKAALGEMVADFAHEVRNPINNISTGLQLVKARLKNDDSNQEVVERMLNDCIRMNHLMDSILSFSRQKYSEFKNVNINQFVQKIVSRFLEKAKSQNIDITLIQEMQDIFIAGDTRALEQVFINIISNAMEILKNEGGVISIKTTINRMKPEMAVITISDTGHGIPEDLRPHLFEPFVSSNPKGTGLGLAITKRIIEAHNGNIHVDTITTGTIFTITFPLLN